MHSDADGFPESTTAPQLYSSIGSTCLCPPGAILVQGLCKLMTAVELDARAAVETSAGRSPQ